MTKGFVINDERMKIHQATQISRKKVGAYYAKIHICEDESQFDGAIIFNLEFQVLYD